ncbi:hypothetical protein EDB83DRAFT_396449 [Lactarius deliciosus]|nr:hypothetical protein EDB83DRAFT_396449 [Lactarius deliciosus]
MVSVLEWIAQEIQPRELVNYVDHPRTWNFFREGPVLTTDEFPFDLDTTSVGLMVTQPDDHVFDSVMNEMLQYTTTDRIPMTYFDAERTRTDPVVALNVLRLFYSRGRGHELSPTLDWVVGVLEHRAYLDGTRYYETAECFLFFAAQLLRATPDPYLHARLAPLLRVRTEERTGAACGDALAMRVLSATVVGLRLAHDLALLLPPARLGSRSGIAGSPRRSRSTPSRPCSPSLPATATATPSRCRSQKSADCGPSVVTAAADSVSCGGEGVDILGGHGCEGCLCVRLCCGPDQHSQEDVGVDGRRYERRGSIDAG